MQSDRIIEKAKKLGIDLGEYSNSTEGAKKVFEALGYNEDEISLDELEKELDDQIANMEMPEEVEEPNESEYHSVRNNKNKYKKSVKKERDEPENNNINQKWKKRETSNNSPKKSWNKLNPNRNISKQSLNPVKNVSKKTNITQPIKTKVKEGTKKTVKKIGKGILKGIKTGIRWLVNLLLTNKLLLLIIIFAILFVFILFIILFFIDDVGTSGSGNNNIGYYADECNYNETKVILKSCVDNTTKTMTLEEYVMGMTQSYIDGYNITVEKIKALMIILKTNALSEGNYNNSNKEITLDDCNKEYTPLNVLSSVAVTRLQNLYDSVKDEIFVSESYNSTINYLSSRNKLPLNEDIFKELLDMKNSLEYNTILDKLYNLETSSNNEVVNDNFLETFFIGDSRTKFMKDFGIVSDSNSVYAGAMGYYWFKGSVSSGYKESSYNCKSNAINCANTKIKSPSNIVIWLGVNDANNYERYYEKYYELATGEWSNHYIYIVSVGYVDDSRSPYVKNNQIITFNDYMKKSINESGLNNLSYIELNYSQEEMANSTLDGVHYSSDFSKKVYSKILESIGSSTNISSKKVIYKLSDYCAFYTLTENDAFWWPIGSKEPTDGNIYGGSPVTTYVSSPFGMRLHPVYKEWRPHNGIDISDEKDNCGEVIIAVKDGVVTTADDFCTETVEGNGCNGGGGNLIAIDHGDGITTRYLHIYPNSVNVEVGQKVNQGEKIALVGTTGTSTGCHLHFEVMVNGTKVDPLEYISAENPRPVNKYNLVPVEETASNSKENKIASCKALIKSGFSQNAVAAMLVNIQAEGNFKTNNLEGCYEENQCCFDGTYGFCMHPEIKGFGSDELYTAGVDSGAYPRDKFINDHAGYGLIQWTSTGRKSGLYDYAKSKNKSIANLSVQLGWLLEELDDEEYSTTYKYITGNYDAYDIANNFCYNFERPRNRETTCPTRAENNTPTMLKFVQNGCSD